MPSLRVTFEPTRAEPIAAEANRADEVRVEPCSGSDSPTGATGALLGAAVPDPRTADGETLAGVVAAGVAGDPEPPGCFEPQTSHQPS
ncbi:MAG: hypothetical protein ACK5H2_12410 [Beutenbergiaceae bacterium]